MAEWPIAAVLKTAVGKPTVGSNPTSSVFFMKFFTSFLTFILLPLLLLAAPAAAVLQTERVIFLFDQGDKNMVASMLKYAEKHERAKLDQLDFCIVFMGASVEAMGKEPFLHYPEKLVHYKDLGIEETIDQNWKRDQKISEASLRAITSKMDVRKKIWVPVSCAVSEQIAHLYQNRPTIEVMALRDNPSPEGESDYFRVAEGVQSAVDKIALPSASLLKRQEASIQKIVSIGHAPIEEWQEEAERLDRGAIIRRMGLDPKLPIIVYTGGYGERYKENFERFLEIVPDEKVQVLIVPHPRYQGVVETKSCENHNPKLAKFRIVGEFEKDPSKNMKTVEAVAIADLVVTADATSTVVFQANALRKKVLHINLSSSKVSEAFGARKLIYNVSQVEEFAKILKETQREKGSAGQDIFELLSIPKQGAKLFWQEFANGL